MEVWRNELKFAISYIDYYYIKNLISEFMSLDRGEEYWIRSLYFDTEDDIDWKSKEEGIYSRKKLRLRIYSIDDQAIKLEIKNKKGDYSHKETLVINKDESNSLIKGDTSWLKCYQGPDKLIENRMSIVDKIMVMFGYNKLAPKVVVDYNREAYYEEFNDIRITFDKNIRCFRGFDLFAGISEQNEYQVNIPNGEMIMEVKYNHYLPDHIRNIVNSLNKQRCSVSKYDLSRLQISGR